MCPVCAAKIAESRRKEVAQCLDGHVKAGGDVYMALFTVPHLALETCQELKTFVTKGWQNVLAGDPWKRVKQKYELHYIRALEVTLGNNGWHPHIHVLFLAPGLSETEREELRSWIPKLCTPRKIMVGEVYCHFYLITEL